MNLHDDFYGEYCLGTIYLNEFKITILCEFRGKLMNCEAFHITTSILNLCTVPVPRTLLNFSILRTYGTNSKIKYYVLD